MHYASHKIRPESIKALQAAGAYMNIKNEYGATGLSMVRWQGNAEITNLFEEAAKVNGATVPPTQPMATESTTQKGVVKEGLEGQILSNDQDKQRG